jgi:hypothetical protein
MAGVRPACHGARLESDDEPSGAEAIAAWPARHERRGPADEALDRLPELGTHGVSAYTMALP